MNSRGTTGRTYWRSLDELAQTPEFRAFVENEFPNHAADMLSSTSRRQFLKIMGASFGLAGLTGCRRWPEEKLVPFAYRPEDRAPGTTLQYATAMELGGSAFGLLVTSYDGRPIKIEGNPLHPASLGSATAIAQASILDLYDPDRSRFLVERSDLSRRDDLATRSWDDFTKFARQHFDELKKNAGAGLAVLSESFSGPSMADMRARFAKAFPQARWYEYEPINRDNEREGLKQAFGRPVRPQLHLDKADVIVSIGADLFGTHPFAMRYAHDWASRRRADSTGSPNGNGHAGSNGSGPRMNRLYVVESRYTRTGTVADERFPIPLDDDFLVSLIFSQMAGGSRELIGSPFVRSARRDLESARGRGIMLAGPSQSAEVHARIARLNAELGNIGQSITLTEDPHGDRPSHVESIKSLVSDLHAGKVKTLLILGGNPVYNAPADLGFAEALAKAETTVRLGLYEDETSQRCRWHLPAAHYLEAWGDARAWDGTISIVQPLIEPLYGGKSAIELVALLTGDPVSAGYDIVRRTFADLLPKNDFEGAWRRTLHDGVLEGSAFPALNLQAQGGSADNAKPTYMEYMGVGTYGIEFVADRKIYDGRFANNGWLQELPDPLFKLVWDNAAIISVADADKRELETGDVIAIRVDGREVEMPVYVMPGQVEDVITLPLGYGRAAAGRVGDGVGFNAYALRTSDAMYISRGTIAKTGKKYALACTQDHQAIDRIGFEERKQRVPELVREISLPVYQSGNKSPHALETDRQDAGPIPLPQLWTPPLKYEEHRWGMAIDLSSCIGCNACVVACQAENNIPIVGKEEVIVGREMHWLRIDRYFSGEANDPNPTVAYQPMTCHHCENAPCESVCPVAATVHDTEGLNTMVYNRCIGTRYCSNNCPYKVRRFNYFDYHSKGPKGGRLPWLGMPDTQQVESIDAVRKMGFNPDVTVRMRGVMEKCTYCVQRIQRAKIQANNEKRTLADGEIVPACAQTCPTQTIVFGDLNDPNSRVRKLQEDSRAYAVLEELNVRPRTKYLARLRNPGEENGTTDGHG